MTMMIISESADKSVEIRSLILTNVITNCMFHSMVAMIIAQ